MIPVLLSSSGQFGIHLLERVDVSRITGYGILGGCLNLDDIAVSFEKEAAVLKGKVQEHCWDPRDRFYYSVDLNLLPWRNRI